ncbi:hypothetical protein ABL78_7950 [Leptomonas seymouri]|uniref:Uncharacterized protein n=1 Tax=Leptomonas seymouri TaxID=5684 RepID=A0A0N1HTA8_LEPSE|nr:hypothetical protein ABL78_7950 [Leptomonas seymouri]|eukprot:KPI83032.1 hypothetical protein ABL78_7950 [Leptomonas seymouri]
MRAVRMRNGGPHVAIEERNYGESAASSETQDCHHLAATITSADTSVALFNKTATMPPRRGSPLNVSSSTVTYNANTNSVPDAALTQTDCLYEADELCVNGNADPLEEAFARDAPLTFTARDHPRVVARFPLHFNEMLITIDQQLQYRQRQAAHLDSVDAAPSLPQSSLASRSRGLSGSDDYPPASDFIGERLPFAVGRAPGCKTKMTHPETGAAVQEENPSAAVATSKEPELSVADEQRLYRERVAEEVLDYLLSPSSPRHFDAAEDASGEDGTPQQRDAADEQRHAMVEACLSGLREIPSDSVEYRGILHHLIQISDAQAASAQHQQQQQEPESDELVVPDVDVPRYARQLLAGCNSPDGGIVATPVVAAERASTSLAGAEPRVPVVASTLRATLDAVLPPRMLLYYIISYDVALEVQQQRRAAQAQQEALRQILLEHPNDRSSQEELEEWTTLLAERYAHTPVGMVLVLMERTSDVQTPRAYLKGLEQSLEEVLMHCNARCCGRPLRLSTSAQNAQQQAPFSLAAAVRAAITTFSPTKPADSKTKGEKGSLKSRTAAATLSILSAMKDPVCTRTTRPPPARPAALSSSGGGSASVTTTLNVLELNKERRLVHFDLLGEELLRQVTVDLPERGVLLRRLMDEARLSLEARGVLARERVYATQERLLEGQDAREALTEVHAQLESEAAQLRERLAFLQARKAGLKAWTEERKTRAAAEERRRIEFEVKLSERLTMHTAAMKAAQDAARYSALA